MLPELDSEIATVDDDPARGFWKGAVKGPRPQRGSAPAQTRPKAKAKAKVTAKVRARVKAFAANRRTAVAFAAKVGLEALIPTRRV